MTMTSGSGVEIIFPVTAVFDIKESKKIIREIEKRLAWEDKQGGVKWLVVV
jgi:hypothetical protein